MTEASRPAANLLPEEGTRLSGHPSVRQEPPLKFAPLSPAQHQVWLSEQLEPGGAGYNIADLYSLRGALRPEILEQAFNGVVRRHEALRTTFKTLDDEAVQVIHPALPLKLPVIDVTHLAEAERKAAGNEHVLREAARPFDLTSGPLLRPTLVRLDEQHHLLSLVIHHIVSDGWSLGVLLREVGRLYQVFLQGEPDPLPELPVQYADFAAWQREWLRGEELEEHLGYWRRQLAGAPSLLELPTDRMRPAARRGRGGQLVWRLPEGLTARLRELSRGQRATLFMTLLAAFKTLLARLAGREDVVVGTPVAGRGRPNVENLIGLFINMLVLRTDLSGEPTFLDVLKRVRDVFLDAHEHQDVPVETLVSELKIERSLSHTPLVQVVFNMLNYTASTFDLPGVEARRLGSPETGSKFDLTLYAQDSPAGLVLTLVYNTDIFGEARMRELLEQFERLLEQVVVNPSTPITRYSLLTSGARKSLPDPAAEVEPEWPGAAHSLLSRRAGLDPTRPALVDARRTWSYQELDERSNRLAHHMLAAGVQRRDVVAIYAHRSAPLVWAMFGVLKAGAAFVILDPAYPRQRLVEYLRVAKPVGLLHIEAAGELPPELEDFIAQRPMLCRLKLHQYGATEAPAAANGSAPPVDDQAAASDLHNSLAAYPATAPAVPIRPRDLAYLAFTSGSTGKPKAVMGTHDSLSHYHSWMQETFGVGESDRFSMLSGLSHDPLLRDIFTPLLLGATLHIPDPDIFGLPGGLARWMKEAEITAVNLTPAMGQMLNEFPGEDARIELTRLRRAFFGGDKLTRRDVSHFRRLAPSASCVNLYGATETQRSLGYYVVPSERGDDDEARAAGAQTGKEVIPVGRGLKGVQLLVLNAGRNLAGIGEAGEIYFRSPHLAKGYWDDPSLTRERFVLNPFIDAAGDRLYRTGDLGRYLPDGNVELIGRADTQVKIRGFRVEPGEVESALREHPSVRECVVVVREDSESDKRLVGYLVARDGCKVSDGDLREHLRERLPDYMIPSAFVCMEALPVTPNGKVNRGALPPPGETPAQDEGDGATPRTQVGEALAEIWRQALNRPAVSLGDNFFELGGHSLLVLRVLSRVGETLRVELPFRSIFEAPTLGAFAERVEAAMRGAGDRVEVPIERAPQGVEPVLSLSQEGWLLREWWEAVHGVRRRPFQLASALRISGTLDLGLLEQALAEVARRHDILRATFPKTKTLLVRSIFYPVLRAVFALKAVHQKLHKLNYKASENEGALKFAGGRKLVILPSMPLPLTVVELEGASETRISETLAEHALRPFDYDNGPLLRVVVVRSSAQKHVVGFVLNHLICDGWSMRVFVSEVLTIYHALAEGRHSPLAELPIQFTDFARWQRERLRGETLRAIVSYWEERFSGVGLFPELALPFARTRRLVKDAGQHVEAQSLDIPSSLLQSLKEIGYSRGVTTYMLLMAALAALMHRYTGAPKISIYSPFANRSRAETQGLIGWFSNVHVLTVDCSGDPAFSELLGRARDAALGAYAHQEVPYLMLIKTLLSRQAGDKMPRGVSAAPHVVFDYIRQTSNSQRLGSLTVSQFTFPSVSAPAGAGAIEVRVFEQPEQMVVTIRYSSEVYESAQINQILDEFRRLLQGAASRPEERILSLPMV